MPHTPFFPNPIFAWSFFAVLMLLLTAAAIRDLATARVPKTITLGIVVTGLIANMLRSIMLADRNLELWLLPTGSIGYGLSDGLLFSLAGLFFAFFLFFGMWMLGVCGGGDVKLCAGIGAWIGAQNTIFLLLTTVVALLLWIVGRIIVGGRPALQEMAQSRKKFKKKHPSQLAPGR